jgi:hypothetical protein
VNAEVAHYRRHPTESGVDLLSARYVTHRYSRHAHTTYTIGLIETGVEEFEHAGTMLRAGAGQVAILNPEVVHTGQAGVPEGWRYRVLYPAVDVVEEIAAELGAPRGTPRATRWRPRRCCAPHSWASCGGTRRGHPSTCRPALLRPRRGPPGTSCTRG